MIAQPPHYGIDPTLTLAQTLYSAPTAHSALLGAGISIAAGVPSGWGVVVQLVEQLAASQGVELDGGDPVDWFKATYKVEPDYSQLIEELAHLPSERQQLLRVFFENADGTAKAEPSLAHRSLARLVAAGQIKIILTLNFDRLMETALRELGIEPTVVTSPGELAGLDPLHMINALVVHLHGDYRSAATMLNTTMELDGYPDEVEAWLDRLLSDYALLIVGWSATHDRALCKAICRQTVRRYTPYWIEPGTLQREAEALSNAQTITQITASGDDALGRVADAVQALTDRQARHPLTLPAAVAAAKRDLAGLPVAISLHDQLHAELGRLSAHPDIARTDFNSMDDIEAVYGRIEEALTLPVALAATIAYWGDAAVQQWWIPEIERYARYLHVSGTTWLIESVMLPSAHLVWIPAIAAVAAERYDLALQLITGPQAVTLYNKRLSVAEWLCPRRAYPMTSERNPSLRLCELYRPIFVEQLGITTRSYDRAWETFEILRLTEALFRTDGAPQQIGQIKAAKSALESAEQDVEASREEEDRQKLGLICAEKHEAVLRGVGSYIKSVATDDVHVRVRDNYDGSDRHPPVVGVDLLAEVDRQGPLHPLVTAGFCGGSAEALSITLEAVTVALGIRGHQESWNAMKGQAGIVSDYFWLDTRVRPAYS